MLRRCFKSLKYTVPQCKQILLENNGSRADGTSPLPLPSLLTLMRDVYEELGKKDISSPPDQREEITKILEKAFVYLSALDQAEEDSAKVAESRVRRSSEGESGKEHFLVLEIMKKLPHSIPIRENGCRCLANLCLLPSSEQGSRSVARQLLCEEEALSFLLGTMKQYGKLSTKGKHWVTLAVLNVLVLSEEPNRPRSEGEEGIPLQREVEEVLSDFMWNLLQELQNSKAETNEEETTLLLQTLDHCQGALYAFLSRQCPDGPSASKAAYYYESVQYHSVSVVLESLLLASFLCLKDVKLNGVHPKNVPAQRQFSHMFEVNLSPLSISEAQLQHIITLFPVLHKTWNNFSLICSKKSNMFITFECFYEIANTNAPNSQADEETLVMNRENNAKYRHYLTELMQSCLFLATEVVIPLPPPIEDSADEMTVMLSEKQKELHFLSEEIKLAILRTFHALSDYVSPKGVEGSEEAEGAGETDDDRTPAAMAMQEMLLANDTTLNICLSNIISHFTDEVHQHKEGNRLVPFSDYTFQILSESLSTLANLSSFGNRQQYNVLNSNTIAALQGILKESNDVLSYMHHHYSSSREAVQQSALVRLFRPSEEYLLEKDGEAADDDEAIQHLFFQYTFLLHKILLVLSNAFHSAESIRWMTEMRLRETLEELLLGTVEGRYVAKSLAEAKRRYVCRPPDTTSSTAAASAAATSTESISETANEPNTKEDNWVANINEESALKLVQLGKQMMSQLKRVETKPDGK